MLTVEYRKRFTSDGWRKWPNLDCEFVSIEHAIKAVEEQVGVSVFKISKTENNIVYRIMYQFTWCGMYYEVQFPEISVPDSPWRIGLNDV